jgi:hypothetical protein
MLSLNSPGSYLIRESENTPSGYALSVRIRDRVQHYKIQYQSESGKFFINARSSFKTLQDLVTHYQQQSDGLCITLKNPCVIIDVSGNPIDEWQLNRSIIQD